MRKTVYVGMSADLLHPGHLHVLRKARSLGRVVVGLLTDEAVASYKRRPMLCFEDRLLMVKSIRGVDRVIPQKTLDYTANLERLKPRYVVHGDDWRRGVQAQTRRKVIEVLKRWGGKLVEVPYTQGISSTALTRALKRNGAAPRGRGPRTNRPRRVTPIFRSRARGTPSQA